MTDSPKVPDRLAKPSTHNLWWLGYLLVGITVNMAIVSIALFYLKIAPRSYSSQVAINLPGSTSTTKVDLPGIGAASYENASPYAGSKEPRENYRFIAMSEPVINAAAKKLRITPKEFGEPKIKIVDGTTIMQFEFTGSSPEIARDKCVALYKAFENRLQELRIQEAAQREVTFQSALSSSREKLEIAQQQLSDYKAKTGLSSDDQIQGLASSIEVLRRSRADLVTQFSRTQARLDQLSANINLSAKQATDAFVLQADSAYQQSLKEYSDASATLITLSAKYTLEHPRVVREKARQEAAREALLTRSHILLQEPTGQQTLDRLTLSGSGSSREVLFRELVLAQVERQGLYAQIKASDQQIAQLQANLRDLVRLESNLDELKRNAQIAEALFSSKLTQLDVNRSNILDSYPLVQVLTEPSLNPNPISPKSKLVLAGALLGCCLIDSGLITLWFRSRQQSRSNKVKDLPLSSDSQAKLADSQSIGYETSKF